MVPLLGYRGQRLKKLVFKFNFKNLLSSLNLTLFYVNEKRFYSMKINENSDEKKSFYSIW